MLACVCHPARAHNLPHSLEIAPQPNLNAHLYTSTQVITKENGNIPVIENESWDASETITENGYVWRYQKKSSSCGESITNFKHLVLEDYSKPLAKIFSRPKLRLILAFSVFSENS